MSAARRSGKRPKAPAAPSKKSRTRQAIREVVAMHAGDVKIQLPRRRRGERLVDFGGREIEALRVRADAWLAQHGLPAADREREPESVQQAAPHRARIVHTVRAGGAEGSRPRRISVVISPDTHRVLGEQG